MEIGLNFGQILLIGTFGDVDSKPFVLFCSVVDACEW